MGGERNRPETGGCRLVATENAGYCLRNDLQHCHLTPTFPIRWGEGEKFGMTFPGVALGGRTTGAYPGLISFTPSAY